MTPLQRKPFLFAGGQFSVKITKNENWGPQEVNHHFYPILKQLLTTDPEHIFLVARPVDDMTEQEMNDMPQNYPNNDKKLLKTECRMGSLNRKDFLYLLEIGVYPFNQSHFDDGTVIDNRKL